MLSDSQIFRLQDVLGCLACYSNDLFGIIENEQFLDLMESYDPMRVEVLHDALQTLWEHVDIIDSFVEKNPFDLSSADLQLALSWKDALHAVGVFVGVEEGKELYLVEGRLLGLDQAEMHESGPCLVNITVLPFENLLVEDYTSMAMDLPAGGPFNLQRDVARARALGIITTPEQFIPFSREVNSQRHEEEMDRLMADLDRESRLHAGEDISPEGFHRGKLAGLTRQQRDERAEQKARDYLYGQLTEVLHDSAIKKITPTTSLSECLMQCTKAQLGDFAKLMGIGNVTGPTKTTLVQQMMDLITAADPKAVKAAELVAQRYASVVLREVLKQVQSGPQVETVTAETMDNSTVACSPFVFPFLYQGQLVGVMPDEMRDLLAKTALPDIVAEKEARETARGIVEDSVFTYGMVTMEEAYHELELLGQDRLSQQQFTAEITAGVTLGEIDAEFCQYNGVSYLINPSLLPQPDTSESLAPTDPREAFSLALEAIARKLGQELAARAEDPQEAERLGTLLEQAKQDVAADWGIAPAQPVPTDEGGEDGFLEERRYLLECQAQIPRKHLYEFAKDGKVGEAVFTSPAADRLVSYLNERVPDGEDDYFFADRVLEEMIFAVVENNVDVVDLLAMADEFGLSRCDNDPQRLLGNLTVLRNSLPLWELNGWSAIEETEMRTGKKMFFDDRGVPLKIGRNDPCPCGSGKAYKDCCGR